MSNSPYEFTCDLCGRSESIAGKCELFERYRTPDVKDVCTECEEEVRRAWRKITRLTDGLCNTLTRRAIQRMRRKSPLPRAAAKRGPWQSRAICGCGWHHEVAFADMYFLRVHYSVCPRCGREVDRDLGWIVRTMRWVSTSVWYRPSTWTTGWWEYQSAMPVGNVDARWVPA